MRILTFTRLWPSSAMPEHGVFVEERMRRVAALPDTELEVVAPVPYFPPIPGPARWTAWAGVPKAETRHGINVEHPRYVTLPGLGGRAHALSLTASAWPVVRRMHKARPFDLIDAHFLHPDGAAAVEIGRRLGIPVVLSARGSDANSQPDEPGMREAIARTIAGATLLISVSRGIAMKLVELGAPPERVAIIPNGIDAKVFHPQPSADEAVRRHVGCGKGERLILSVGRLEHVKGHDVLLDALAILARAVHVRAVIVGEGRQRGELEEQAARLGIGDRVLFAGSVPHESLAAWYSAADVFCLPSRSEGHPNVLVEALACGTPAVAAAVGAAGEVLSPECGLLVPPEDPSALATALAAALARSWDHVRVRSRVASRSWERVAESVRAVHEEAVRRHAGVAGQAAPERAAVDDAARVSAEQRPERGAR